MFKSYIKIAWRNLVRNKTYSVVNIPGLSISIACALLILLWVKGERSWDQFHQDKSSIYQLWVNTKAENGIRSHKNLPYPLGSELERTIPGIKYTAMTDEGGDHLLSYGDKKIKQKGYYVTPSFFQVFSFPITESLSPEAFADQNSILITKSLARALFGNVNPLNRIIRIDNKFDLKVSGLLEDVPPNSSLQFDCLMPMQQYVAANEWVRQQTDKWNVSFLNIYIRAEPGISSTVLNQRLKGVLSKYRGDKTKELFLHPLKKWHLYSEFKDGVNSGGLIEYVRLFTLLAAFIIVIACINFMNLSTASSEKRAKEVGVRKAMGSKRKELIKQFICESLLVTGIAYVIAIFLVTLALPFFNTLVGRKLAIDFSNPFYWGITLLLILVTGLIAGSYPAFYLSSFSPVSVLKGVIRAGKAALAPRRVMITLQFTFSILLIIGTLVIYRQIQHVKNRPLGYNSDNLLMIEPNEELNENFPLLKNELLNKGLAQSISKASSPITDIFAYMSGVDWPGKREDEQVRIGTIAAGYDYVKTIGASFKTGRDFDRAFPTDSFAVLLNEEAEKMMNLKLPIGTNIRRGGQEYRIIGVIRNMVMTSPYEAVPPTMILFNEQWANIPLIRLRQDTDLRSTLAAIRQVYYKYCPSFPFEYHFADQEYQRKFATQELIGKLANLFAGLTIFISCLGLFGLAAFSCEQRRKEIGIRKVVGADVTTIVNLLTREFLKLVLLAFIIASPVSWWVMNNWLNDFPYRTDINWRIFIIAGTVAVFFALITVSFHAIRAATSNPAKSLRTE